MLVALAGVVLGLLLWHVAPRALAGDTLFHVARVRKLVELGVAHARGGSTSSCEAGSIPVMRSRSGTRSSRPYRSSQGSTPRSSSSTRARCSCRSRSSSRSKRAPLLFRSPRARGAAHAAAQVAMIALAPGHGGAYPLLDAARAGGAPAARARGARTRLLYVREPSWTTLLVGRGGGARARARSPDVRGLPLHPARAAGSSCARSSTPRMRGGSRPVLAAVAAADCRRRARAPAAEARPSRTIERSELGRRALRRTAHRPRVELQARAGESSDEAARSPSPALVLVPFAGLAWRRRWSSFVLGGSLAVLAVTLTPFLFERLSDAVSLSQSRRAAGFLPFAFAFAGGIGRTVEPARDARAAARARGRRRPPAALAGRLRLQARARRARGRRRGSPSSEASSRSPRRSSFARGGDLESRDGLTACAAALFLLPAVVHGFVHWSTPTRPDPNALTPGLVRVLRDDLPKRAVVFSDMQTSYRIAAYAPVLIVAAPPEHVADTKQNDPYAAAGTCARSSGAATSRFPVGTARNGS